MQSIGQLTSQKREKETKAAACNGSSDQSLTKERKRNRKGGQNGGVDWLAAVPKKGRRQEIKAVTCN